MNSLAVAPAWVMAWAEVPLKVTIQDASDTSKPSVAPTVKSPFKARLLGPMSNLQFAVSAVVKSPFTVIAPTAVFVPAVDIVKLL